MLEEIPNQSLLQKKIMDMEKEIASLKKQQANNAPMGYQQQGGSNSNKFSQGDPKPSSKLFPTRIRYYCHREGHGTFSCPEALEDEQQGLVRRAGNDWFLRSGQQIPWNPKRPIRHVVATKSAKVPPKPAVNSAFQTEHPSVFQTQHKAEATPETSSSLHKIEWEPFKLGSSNFERVQVEANAATKRAEALRGRRKAQMDKTEMDVDQEKLMDEVIKEIPSVRRTPGQILE
jgi:hypothetical protein